jgi:hypothetical protein
VLPEHELWCAVLLRAIEDLVGSHLIEQRRAYRLVRHNAETWILSPSLEPGSFQWICSNLNLDAEAVRRHAFQAPLSFRSYSVKNNGSRLNPALTIQLA